MKNKLLFFLLIINLMNAYGQKAKLGVNYNPLLTREEARFIEKCFYLENFDFQFKEKKVAYVLIDFEITLISKPNFFEHCVKYDSLYHKQLLVLNKSEKEKSKGYDAVIVFKKKDKDITEKKREKIIKKILDCEINKPSYIDSLGIDNLNTLNKYETDFFNKRFLEVRKTFDFKNKKIGFFFGNNGSNIWSKKEYFDSYKKRISEGLLGTMDFLLLLSEKEKIESGGYDAIIVSWSKILVTKPTKKMIRKLKKQ